MRQFDIWIADLNPRSGTEPGKIRPVLIVQTDFLNRIDHPSTLVCPITTNVALEATILRINLKNDIAGLVKDSDVLIDQIRAIDNKRLIKKLGILPKDFVETVKENIKIMLDLD